MSHALAEMPVTIAEFDAFAERQPEGAFWELVDGRILAMTNPTGALGQIAVNIGVRLSTEGRQSGCRINIGGMAVQSNDNGTGLDKTIPDIVVMCGAWSRERTFVTDPSIVVEILSPSTMDFDRGPKLTFYKTVSALQDILIVYQDEIRIEHYRREGDGWRMDPLVKASDKLSLIGLPCTISLSDIYADTGLDDR